MLTRETMPLLPFLSTTVWQEFSCVSNTTCAFRTGEEFLEQADLGDIDVTSNFLVLLAMFVVYRFMAYLGLRFMYSGKTFKERWNE